MQVYTKTLLACVLALAAANFSVAQEDDKYAKEYNTKPETDFHNIFRRDESALYVELLAIKLRKLDDRLQRIAMHKIDTIMFDLISDSSQSPNSVIFKVIQSDMPSLRFSAHQTPQLRFDVTAATEAFPAPTEPVNAPFDPVPTRPAPQTTQAVY